MDEKKSIPFSKQDAKAAPVINSVLIYNQRTRPSWTEADEAAIVQQRSGDIAAAVKNGKTSGGLRASDTGGRSEGDGYDPVKWQYQN